MRIKPSLLILILPLIPLHQCQQFPKRLNSTLFHQAGVKLFFVVLDPVEVAATFGGVMAGGIAMVGGDEVEDFVIGITPRPGS